MVHLPPLPRLAATLLSTMLGLSCATAAAQIVRFTTSEGDIVVRLDREKAPKSVENFMQYVKAGHYNGVIFHRVVENFVIQTGGYTANLAEKPTRAPIPLESDNGLSNRRGTLGMARQAAPNSASAQWYINVSDNLGLDKALARDGNGYAVFGEVVEGMDVVDAIRKAPVAPKGVFTHLPVKPVTIQRVRVEQAESPPRTEPAPSSPSTATESSK